MPVGYFVVDSKEFNFRPPERQFTDRTNRPEYVLRCERKDTESRRRSSSGMVSLRKKGVLQRPWRACPAPATGQTRHLCVAPPGTAAFRLSAGVAYAQTRGPRLTAGCGCLLIRAWPVGRPSATSLRRGLRLINKGGQACSPAQTRMPELSYLDSPVPQQYCWTAKVNRLRTGSMIGVRCRSGRSAP